MGEYVGMGEYVQMGAEEELGFGMEEELGLEAELGAIEYGPSSQIGQGIGSNWGPAGARGSLVRQVPERAFTAPVPQRSFIKAVQPAGVHFDKAASVYTGSFAGKRLGC
jgi:hypothetical protein